MPNISNVAQDLITIESILKEEYLSFVNNNLNVTPSPFLEMIKKEPLTASTGRFGARTGIGGGFGMSAERNPTPSAGAPLYNDFRYESKDGYVDVQISHKDIVLGQSNRSVLIDTVRDMMDASYEAAEWNVSRMLFGDGKGVLAQITAAVTTSSPKIKVDDVTKLMTGLVIDIYAPAASVGTAPSTAAVQIIAIDENAKEITLSANPTAALSSAASSSYGFITVQGSYGREITGLSSVFDNTVTSIYGVNKAANPWVKPYSVSAGHDIDDTKLTDAVSYARDRRNTKIDLIMCSPSAYRAYEYYMKEGASNYNIVDKRKFVGGSTGYEILCGEQLVTIVREKFVPDGKMWGVDSNQFTLRHTGWDFAAYKGDIFTLINGTSVYRALLANYMELICKMPGGCIEITDCASA